MDQKKIGEFIAKCRKEKNLTQQELADKLNITKNAVSKWERGLSLMDISLLKQVSEILDISVNELLNGERIELMEKNAIDDTIVKSMNTYVKKDKKKIIRRTIIFTIITIALLWIILTIISEANYGIIPLGDNAYIDFQNISSRVAKKNADKYMEALKNKDIEFLDSFVVSNGEHLLNEEYVIDILPEYKELLEETHSKTYQENLEEFYQNIDIISYEYKFFYNGGRNYIYDYDMKIIYDNEEYTVMVQVSSFKDYVQSATFGDMEGKIEEYSELYKLLFKIFRW